MNNSDYEFILDLVEAGRLDGMMPALADAVRARQDFLREMRGANNRITMVPGTKVRLINIRPKYLWGVTGVVATNLSRRRDCIVVDIDPSCYHRLGTRYSRQLSVPASSLEEI